MLKGELIARAVTMLNFHAKWLEYDLISELFLLKLYQLFIDSDDKSTEHYRYRAFQNLLQDNQYLDDRSIDNYIELAEIDDDRSMAIAALMDILTWNGLNDEQYTRLVDSPKFASQIFQTYHQNKIMMRIIGEMQISDEIIKNCIQNYSSDVQECLLYKKGIQRYQIDYIHQHGKNKRIRNMAKNMLRNRHYQ